MKTNCEETKKCSQCDEVKSVELFPMKLGKVNSYCKECLKKYSAARYYRKREEKNAYSREYYRKNKKKRLKSMKAYQDKNKDKYKSRQTLRNAVAAGKIEKTPCKDCGETKVEARHQDYSKPLEVEWLCKTCHADRHRIWTQEKAEAMYVGR